MVRTDYGGSPASWCPPRLDGRPRPQARREPPLGSLDRASSEAARRRDRRRFRRRRHVEPAPPHGICSVLCESLPEQTRVHDPPAMLWPHSRSDAHGRPAGDMASTSPRASFDTSEGTSWLVTSCTSAETTSSPASVVGEPLHAESATATKSRAIERSGAVTSMGKNGTVLGPSAPVVGCPKTDAFGTPNSREVERPARAHGDTQGADHRPGAGHPRRIRRRRTDPRPSPSVPGCGECGVESPLEPATRNSLRPGSAATTPVGAGAGTGTGTALLRP
jgi:hypothetical protein